MKTFDLIVIGGGSGGVRAARLAAERGLATAIIEKRHWGGTCVNLGCIPKKYMVLAADYSQAIHHATDYGWDIDQPSFRWSVLRTKLHQETQRLQSVYYDMLTSAGVELIEGEARLLSSSEIAVGEVIYKANRVLLATGGRPFIPDIPGKQYAWSSDDIFSLPQLPHHIAIIGGGYIALEFASILCGLGVEVTIVHRSPYPLRQLDKDLTDFLMSEMDQRIRWRLNSNVVAISRDTKHGYSLKLDNGDLEADGILFAIGRTPNLIEGLAEAGIAKDSSGKLVVDDYYRTSQPHIFAVGDLVGNKPLTPVAIAEASLVIASDFGDQPLAPVNYDAVPTAVFCRPEVATIGKSESQAGQEREIEVYKSSFFPMKQMFFQQPSRFFIKLLCEKNNGKLLGLHLAGEGAAEMIQGFAVAYAAGLSKKDLDDTIGIHPTIAEELLTLK